LIGNETVSLSMLVATFVVLGSVAVALQTDAEEGVVTLPLRDGDG
jgi:hypothetical protein